MSTVDVTIHAYKLEQVAYNSDSDSYIEISYSKASPEKQLNYSPLHPAPKSCPTDCPLSPTYKPHPPKRQSNSFPIATQCVRQKKHQCPECNCMLRWKNIEKHLRKVHSKNSWDKSIYGQKESYNQWIFQGEKNKKHIAKRGAKLKNKQFAFADECCWNPIFNPRSLRRQPFHT